ncbi:hypothetical protein [Streptomyces litmocidini]|uniref:hypothetical protein n=1 Tax=Streptomyces litmocidini TaxID=67318 RepID=UPI00167D09C5|nr:hypothetical protein [Streptomyces litmocidini]
MTAERLRRLLEDAEQARADAVEANARASELHRRHVARVDHLNGRVESAESDAAILREHVAECETALKESAAEVGALREELDVARRAAVVPMALLLRDGAPHSVHASVQAAKDHAATLGANPSGWTAPGLVGGTPTGWSIMPFRRNGAVS